MEYWIFPVNPDLFDTRNAFRDLNTVHWQQGRIVSINIGDIAFIYESKPTKGIIMKTEVVSKNEYGSDIDVNRYSIGNNRFTAPWLKLKLISEFSSPIPLNLLNEHGLKGNIQTKRRLDYEIVSALNLLRMHVVIY